MRLNPTELETATTKRNDDAIARMGPMSGLHFSRPPEDCSGVAASSYTQSGPMTTIGRATRGCAVRSVPT